jgi:hypothetical protein
MRICIISLIDDDFFTGGSNGAASYLGPGATNSGLLRSCCSSGILARINFQLKNLQNTGEILWIWK